jgi:hypothetical protein
MTDSELDALKRRVNDLERRLDAVDGGRPAPPALADTQLQGLVRDGMTMLAVQRYRELTGAGLGESKRAVDELMKG